MENIYENLVKTFTEEDKAIRSKLYDIGLTGSDIQESLFILKCAKPIFPKALRDKEEEIIKYNAAKHQANYMASNIIKRKIRTAPTGKCVDMPMEESLTLVKDLFKISELLNYTFVEGEYVINLAAKMEAVYVDHEEDYYIIAQKDTEDKGFEYTYIGQNEIVFDYTPTEKEIKVLLKVV